MQTIRLVFMAVLLALIVYLAMFYGREESKVYQCSLAEISPDYPIEVKNMCRKLVRKPQ